MKINKQKILISEFKKSIHNQELKPFKTKEGTVVKGLIEPIHFYFYAIIRLADTNKIFNNEYYLLESKRNINSILKNYTSSNFFINKLIKVFPSLTINDIIFFSENYKKIKADDNE